MACEWYFRSQLNAIRETPLSALLDLTKFCQIDIQRNILYTVMVAMGSISLYIRNVHGYNR